MNKIKSLHTVLYCSSILELYLLNKVIAAILPSLLFKPNKKSTLMMVEERILFPTSPSAVGHYVDRISITIQRRFSTEREESGSFSETRHS